MAHTGCGGDPPAPGFGPRSPSRSPGPVPNLPERPLVSRDGLPSPSGSGLGVQLGGQRREGGQRMRRLSPGRGGRRALPDSGGRRPARYSRRAWRSRARCRPRAPGRASAARTLRSGLSEAPQRRPLLGSQRSTINLLRLRGHQPARQRRGQSARGLCSQSGRGAREDAGRRYPGLPRGGAGGQPEEPRLPWKPPPSLQGPLGLKVLAIACWKLKISFFYLQLPLTLGK